VLWNDDYLKSFAQRVLDSATSASTEDNLQFWIDLHTKLANILIDAFSEEQDGMRITEEEQLLINKQMNKLFGINVISSPTEKTNGST
jgi:succinylglutamate desuccinylase